MASTGLKLNFKKYSLIFSTNKAGANVNDLV